jgi:hypothetical protein
MRCDALDDSVHSRGDSIVLLVFSCGLASSAVHTPMFPSPRLLVQPLYSPESPMGRTPLAWAVKDLWSRLDEFDEGYLAHVLSA